MPSPKDTRPSPSRTTALLLAAGEGRRAGIGRSKAFLREHGKTLLERDLERVAPFCTRRLVGLRPADMDDARPILEPFRAEAVAGARQNVKLTFPEDLERLDDA